MRTHGVRMPTALACVLAAGSGGWPSAADAAVVICKRKAKLTLRETRCKKKETEVPASELGGARWALVDAAGTIVAQSGGISVATAEEGFYVLDFGSSQTGKSVQVSPTLTAADQAFRGVGVAGLCGGAQASLDICPTGLAADRYVYVATTSTTNTEQQPHAFYVVVF